MVLFIFEDFADVLGHGVFFEFFALGDAFAIVADGFGFVFEIELEACPIRQSIGVDAGRIAVSVVSKVIALIVNVKRA